MSEPEETKTVHVVLSNSMASEEWDLDPPTNVPTHILIRKIVQETNAQTVDQAGNAIPYRLMWNEGERYLKETETLAQAGVLDNHHLVLSYETRAGGGGRPIGRDGQPDWDGPR